MTGDPRLETAVEAVELGALRYLVKPVAPDELTAVVGQAVSLGHLAAAKRELIVSQGGHDRLIGDRAGLEAAFEGALGTLWMAFQPILRARDQTLFGYEALLRSRRAPLLTAVAFLDAARRLEKMEPLGQALRACLATTMEGEFEGTLFINLSPAELTDESLYSRDAPLSRFAKRCILEITEREALEGVAGLRARIRTLKELGFRVAIDDLGAGYAGLTSFAALEPEVVKLDRSLVTNADTQPLQRRVIDSIVRLCGDLGIMVVAEGVETAAERDTLVDLGCDLLQGYFLGRPSSLAEGRARA
jgi:EAL domain-containing protein (putative c-di-GMP-specific phosphodiesterase class I)